MKKKWRIFSLLMVLCFASAYAVEENTKNLNLSETQQSIRITGKVLDAATGEALIGVSVVEKGTGNGMSTDVDGNFTLTVGNPNAVLDFQYLGYTSVSYNLEGRKDIVIQMSEDIQILDEVVVVGYGIQKKINLTGAITSVSGQDIASKATTDVLSAMQGQMPGVSVLRTGGQPGHETSGLRVRGFSSANAADALILIDGVEGSLTMLNSQDIESVSVLKDAAAASIYGARAAGGVVLVTTKKGTSQKMRISYNGSFGINTPGNMPQRMSPWEEQDYINSARNADRGAPEQNAEQTSWVSNPNYNYYPNGTRWTFHGNTNWLDEGTKDYTMQQNHAASVSGGHGNTRYYVSLGYHNKNGMLKYGPDDYSRYNLRATMNTEMNKYLELNLQTSYEMGVDHSNPMGPASVLSHLYNDRGRQAIYLPEEDTNYENNPYSADLQQNAIDAMKNGGEVIAKNQYFTGNVNLRIKELIKGLTLDLNASRRAGFYSYEGDYRFRPSMGRDGAARAGYEINNPNRVVKTKNDSYQDKLEAIINYDLKIDNHSLHIMGGASYEQYLKDEISATARNLLSNDFFSFNYYDSTEPTNTVLSDAIQPWKMASLFGRVNYDFAGRYLLEANVRYDGSSRLASGNRWGVFPSTSVGWRVSEEAFYEPVREYMDNFKVRFSWGQLGNSTVLNSMYYPYFGLISNKTETSTTSILSIMGNPVYYQKAMVSEDVTWETLTSTDIGVDMSFFKNKLNVTADYYWKTNDDMLAQLRVGNIAGVVELPYQNVGKMKAWGWEVSVDWRDKIGDVSYRVGINVDDSQNKLVSYAGNNVINAGAVKLLEGYALNTIWGYKTDGFWNSREEYLAYKDANPGYQSFNDAKVSGGDVRYLAQGKADHTIGIGGGTPDDPGDLVYLGSSNGRYMYGINLGVEWKGFDFSCFFQGVGKRSFILNATTLAPLGYSYQMPWTVNRDYWTEDNKNAYFARPYEGQTFNYNPADRWVQDGAYIRLKDIQLGYSIPVSKKVFQQLRLYVAGTDVWEYTNVLKAFDPEVGNEKDTNYYPFFRTWTMGLNLTF
ncbi:MAG: TonB-dependent receptor [Dysgonamonadaceae bacterium]|jgi:TonB-linked SusC/RagA family outer membrane protein|nr:TonB-dependent receptor [Dysgonamonadaceae bacterium]